MAEERLLQEAERAVLEKLAGDESTEGQRAHALLAVDAGATYAEAAEQSGLTSGQVGYAVRKFRSQRLLAFPGATQMLPSEAVQVEETAGETAVPPTTLPADAETQERVGKLLDEVDELIEELRTTLPPEERTPYSPLRMLTLVRSYVGKYTPQVQLQILEPFEGMTREDLLDLDTWKGLAYMIRYSAQFQATQAKDRLNEQMPEPLKPDTIFRTMKSGLDRFTPEVAKQIAASFEGATREDLLDPETWKGMAYMLGYSAQFQATQAKDRLNQELPDPLKPDTVFRILRESLDRFTPEVARQIAASFEDATLEDFLDPETWKGVWYMLNYSLQFQAEQLRNRLQGTEAAEEIPVE